VCRGSILFFSSGMVCDIMLSSLVDTGFFSQDSNISICRENTGSYAYSSLTRERLNGDLSKILIYKGVSENKGKNSLMLRTLFRLHVYTAHVRPPHTFGPTWHQGLYPIIEKTGVKYLY